MKIITHLDIMQLNISMEAWYDWVDTVLKNKEKYIMPAKTSLHFGTGEYFNTMPSILSEEDVMGTKVVNRHIGRVPSLESQLLLYQYSSGELLALMDANLITAMRTGASAVHAIQLFAKEDFYEIGIMGFGNIGVAVIKVLTEHFKERKLKVKLLKYKNHIERIKGQFEEYENIKIEEVDSVERIIRGSDVIISCITYTDQLLGENTWFKEGCLVLPVHLRGFQNCDLFFDKVYGDDTGQVKGFQYFKQFKQFGEVSDVLNGRAAGRENNRERIIVYNVGLSLHDIYAANQIYKLSCENSPDTTEIGPKAKYWL